MIAERGCHWVWRVEELVLQAREWRLRGRDPTSLNSFSSHPHLYTFSKSAKLALVPMMLVYRTISATAARISQIASNTPFKKRFATFARKLSVVFPGAFVPTDHTLNILIFVSTTGAVLRRSLTTQKRQITSWCIWECWNGLNSVGRLNCRDRR